MVSREEPYGQAHRAELTRCLGEGREGKTVRSKEENAGKALSTKIPLNPEPASFTWNGLLTCSHLLTP